LSAKQSRGEAEGTGSALVVDDDAAITTVLVALLGQAGIRAERAASGEEALEALAIKPIDVVLTDVRMPGMGGLALLRKVHARWPEIPVLMMTAHASVPLAVEAMKEGASEFLLKPFDRDEIVFVVRKAIEAAKHQEASPPQTSQRMLGSSRAMVEVSDLLARAARSTATVLIRGETGTGKELAARAIHDRGPRRDGPFVAIHCGALPDALLESELFGYEKGAFTGASCRKPGRIELAQGGTVFLDEIGDISPQTQVKLLRVVQERSIERLGGTETIPVDVRFVAATHRDLEEMVRRQEFREDLFYRLNVVPVTIPPLRARPEDIEALAVHFCATLGGIDGRPAMKLEPAALDRLRAESWPGNIRQLQNFVERLIVLCDGPILRVSDVERELARGRGPLIAPPPSSQPSGAGSSSSSSSSGEPGRLDDHRRAAEREALERAIAGAGNNRSLAARVLGISRRTLYNKLAELGMV
jgi:two-component system response regulator AtoC